MSTDPYLASAASLTPPPVRLDIESAGKLRRFCNYLIDLVAMLCVGIALGVAAAVIGGEPAIRWIDDMSRPMEWLLNIAICLAYYTLLEGAFGVSIGKLITNTRVVDEHGRRPGFRRALLRSLCRIIPFEAFSLLFSDNHVRRGWHDSLPRTYVIRRPRAGQPAGTPRREVHTAFAAGPAPAPPPPPLPDLPPAR